MTPDVHREVRQRVRGHGWHGDLHADRRNQLTAAIYLGGRARTPRSRATVTIRPGPITSTAVCSRQVSSCRQLAAATRVQLRLQLHRWDAPGRPGQGLTVEHADHARGHQHVHPRHEWPDGEPDKSHHRLGLDRFQLRRPHHRQRLAECAGGGLTVNPNTYLSFGTDPTTRGHLRVDRRHDRRVHAGQFHPSDGAGGLTYSLAQDCRGTSIWLWRPCPNQER